VAGPWRVAVGELGGPAVLGLVAWWQQEMGRGTLMVSGKKDDFGAWGLEDLAFCKRVMSLLDGEGPKEPGGRLVAPFRWWRDALAEYVRICEKGEAEGEGKDVVGRRDGDRPSGGGARVPA